MAVSITDSRMEKDGRAHRALRKSSTPLSTNFISGVCASTKLDPECVLCPTRFWPSERSFTRSASALTDPAGPVRIGPECQCDRGSPKGTASPPLRWCSLSARRSRSVGRSVDVVQSVFELRRQARAARRRVCDASRVGRTPLSFSLSLSSN